MAVVALLSVVFCQLSELQGYVQACHKLLSRVEDTLVEQDANMKSRVRQSVDVSSVYCYPWQKRPNMASRYVMQQQNIQVYH